MPLSMQLQRQRDAAKVYTAVVNISVDEVIPNSFADANIIDFSGFAVGDEFEVKINRALNSATEEIVTLGLLVGIDQTLTTLVILKNALIYYLEQKLF